MYLLDLPFPFIATISYIGAVFFLGAFAALNLRLVTSESYSYQISNVLGALCFTYAAFNQPFNWGLFITESIWALIGIYGIVKIVLIAKKRGAEKS